MGKEKNGAQLERVLDNATLFSILSPKLPGTTALNTPPLFTNCSAYMCLICNRIMSLKKDDSQECHQTPTDKRTPISSSSTTCAAPSAHLSVAIETTLLLTCVHHAPRNAQQTSFDNKVSDNFTPNLFSSEGRAPAMPQNVEWSRNGLLQLSVGEEDLDSNKQSQAAVSSACIFLPKQPPQQACIPVRPCQVSSRHLLVYGSLSHVFLPWFTSKQCFEKNMVPVYGRAQAMFGSFTFRVCQRNIMGKGKQCHGNSFATTFLPSSRSHASLNWKDVQQLVICLCPTFSGLF